MLGAARLGLGDDGSLTRNRPKWEKEKRVKGMLLGHIIAAS